MQQQVQMMADELGSLKAEIIQLKAAHATMHQSTVDSNAQAATKFTEQAQRVMELSEKIERGSTTGSGFKTKTLIEPKNIVVDIFSGSVADNRS